MDNKLKRPAGESMSGKCNMNSKSQRGVERKLVEGSRRMRDRGNRSKILISYLITAAMVLSLLGSGTVPAYADVGSKYDMQWFTSFGEDHYDEGFSVIAVEDGFVYTGTVSDNKGLEYTFLVKADEKGKTVWEKRFGGIFRSSGRSVSSTADGGYIIAGTSKTFMESNDKVYLIKTDGEGNLQWEQKLDLSDQGYAYSKRQGFSVKEAADGSYIIVGAIIMGDTSDALVIKTNSLGHVSWAQLYGGAQWDWFYDVEVVEDGFVVGGTKEINNRYYEYLIKIGAFGDVIWEYTGSTPGGQIKNLLVTSDGSIMATGYRNSVVSLLKLSSDGVVNWSKIYDNGIGYGIAEQKNGDFVIAGNENILGIKPTGAKSWVQTLMGNVFGMNAYAKNVVVNESGSMVFTGSVNQGNSDVCLFQLGADRASLGVSSPNVLVGGSVYLFAPVFLADGESDTTATAEAEVKVRKGDEVLATIPLSDGNFYPSDDFEDHDGVYSAWYDVPESVAVADSVDFELFVDGVKEDTKTVNVIDEPELIVLTHFQALYEEFIDTGTSATLDEDSNKVPDYFDLMERIHRYAESYKGVVLDVNEEIITDKGFTRSYSELDYDDSGAYHMADLIDILTHDIFNNNGIKLKNVAIIGDDEVIPFYRKKDPIYAGGVPKTNESKYVSLDMRGKDYGNPTLQDTNYRPPHIMTDVPYGTFAGKPDVDFLPTPVAGVGRIFADRPSTLIDMIDGYETPINLIPEESCAAVFSLDKDPGRKIIENGVEKEVEGVDFPKSVKNAITSVLDTKYKHIYWATSPAYGNGNYYWHEGTVRKWGGSDVIAGIEKADLSFIWSHANHILENTQDNPDLTHNTFRNLLNSPGRMLINAGCHSGYTVSHNNSMNKGESYLPYDQSMVKQIISKQIAYMAPTAYGYGSNAYPTDHDLLSKLFLEALLDGATGTVGEKWRKAYEDYNAYMTTHPDDYTTLSIYAIYGMGYYGLPTQPVVSSAVDLDLEDELNILSRAAIEASPYAITESRQMDVSIAIPEPMLTTDNEGSTLLEIPGGSSYTMTYFAPCLPLIQKTYILPAGSNVESVSLAGSTERAVLGPMQLQMLVPVDKTTGSHEGNYELEGPYPAERITWLQQVREDGVYLTLVAAPVQYDPATEKVTVLSSMEFDIAYTAPVSGNKITEVIVSNGSTVKVGVQNIPVDVKIDSDSGGEALLQWQVRESSELVIESGTQSLVLTPGSNNVEFDFDTEGWTPGNKALTLLLRKDGVASTSWFGDIEVSGLYADLFMEQRVYDPSELVITFVAGIRDEDGAPISGILLGDFDVNVDGGSIEGLVMEEASDAAGSYQFSFPLASVAEDIHELTLSCAKAGNRSALVTEIFVVREDTAAPEVIRTDPAQYEAGVPSDAVITITFGEAIFEDGSFAGIQLLREEEDADVLVEVNKTISLDSLILTPVNPLELNSVYKLIIPSKAVKDSKDNTQVFPYQLRFVTYAEPDLTAPVVEATLPDDGELDFPAMAAVKVDFSESVGAGVNAADISWTADETPVSFNMTFYANQLILTPSASVPYRAACQVTIPAGAINDLSGNPLESKYTLGFTIEDAEDSQAPRLLSSMPEHEMTGVLTDALITLRFDEIVLEGAAYSEISLTEVNDGVPEDPLSYSAELQRDTLTLIPTQSFKMNQGYVVTIPAGAVEDLIGNSLEDSIEIRFTTGDLADEKAPSIEETIPGDGEEGVLPDTSIYVYFDEAIYEGDSFGDIALLDKSAGDEGDDVAFTSSISGRTLILTPTVALDHSCNYRVRIPVGSVKDLTGNASGSAVVFDFTIEDAPDTQPPRLTESSPSEGAKEVSAYAQITFTFDEFIQAGTAYGSIGIAGEDGDIPFTKSISGRQLTLVITGGMPLSTEITISLPTGSLSDLLGNQSDEDISLYFTTVTEDVKDVTPPVTTHSVAGMEGTAGWYTSSVQVTLTATEDLSGVALTSWSLDGQNWESYSDPFTVAQQGEVTIYYKSADREGNEESVKTFTVSIDTVSPTVSSSVPLNNATGVPLSQTLKVAFSDNISGGSAYGNIELRNGTGPVSMSKAISGKQLTITPGELDYNTTYTLVIPTGAVVDTAGNNLKAEYNLSFTTATENTGGGGGIGGGGGGGAMPPAEEIDVTGSIDGKEHPFVRAGERDESGIIPILVDDNLLNRGLAAGGNAPRIAIRIGNAESFLFTGLTGQTVKDMEGRDAVLDIRTGLAGCTIPAALLDIDSVAVRFGENVPLQDIAVDIRVAAATADWMEIIENAEHGGRQILIPPMEFAIECNYNGRTILVEHFRAPVERTMPIPAGMDPNKITTAVVVERDGTLRHIPTRITIVDGVYFAEVTCFTNEVYTLIWNRVEFSDMERHWAKEYVNDLGSRLVVAGVSDRVYSPDRPVTRAELAAIITRSLGVTNRTDTCEFTDVSQRDWFLRAVTAATECGIVSGYGDDTFRPDQMVTKEESFAMIARAMEFACMKTAAATEIADGETKSILEKFSDRDKLSSWCEKSAAYAIKNGLVTGYGGKLMPQSHITRAEVATIVSQMLKSSELINR